MAKMLLTSVDFHRDMQALLDPFGQYVAAKMKGYARIKAKCSKRGGGDYSAVNLQKEGEDSREPTIRHVKDCLRASVLMGSHEDLAKAHAALIAAFKPVATKDRRGTHAHDVLQTVWYNGIICEVQLHYRGCVVLKTLSHAAYNITRVETENLNSVRDNLIIFPHKPVAQFSEAEVKPAIHF